MKKITLVFFLFLAHNSAAAAALPNEAEIYFHIHQATHWAELMYSKKCSFSKPEMDKHLKKIKYTQTRLVDSKFYLDYLFLEKLAFNRSTSNHLAIEQFRDQIHEKAEKHKIEHPKNWRDEFLICSK